MEQKNIAQEATFGRNSRSDFEKVSPMVPSEGASRRRNFALERSESPLGGVIADNRFRVTDQNTAKLWENFESHIRQSVSGSMTNLTNNSATGQASPPRHLDDKRTNEGQEYLNNSSKSLTHNIYANIPNNSALRNRSPGEMNIRESQITGDQSANSNRLIDLPLQTDQEKAAPAQNSNQISAKKQSPIKKEEYCLLQTVPKLLSEQLELYKNIQSKSQKSTISNPRSQSPVRSPDSQLRRLSRSPRHNMSYQQSNRLLQFFDSGATKNASTLLDAYITRQKVNEQQENYELQNDSHHSEETLNRIVQEELRCSPIRYTYNESANAQSPEGNQRSVSSQRLRMNVRMTGIPSPNERERSQKRIYSNSSKRSNQGKNKQVQFNLQGQRQYTYASKGSSKRLKRQTESPRIAINQKQYRQMSPNSTLTFQPLMTQNRPPLRQLSGAQPNSSFLPAHVDPVSMAVLNQLENEERQQESEALRKNRNRQSRSVTRPGETSSYECRNILVNLVKQLRGRSRSGNRTQEIQNENKNAQRKSRSRSMQSYGRVVRKRRNSCTNQYSTVNHRYDAMNVTVQESQKRLIKERVLVLLSDVLRLRRATVKHVLAHRVSNFYSSISDINLGDQNFNVMEPVLQQKQGQPPEQEQAMLTKLVTSERLLKNLPFETTLRMLSALLLLQIYFSQGHFERILRYLEQDTKINLALPAQIAILQQKGKLPNQDQASYCIHLLTIKGECHLLNKEYEKSVTLLSQVCNLYNRWKTSRRNILKTEEDLDRPSDKIKRLQQELKGQLEFGVDDYIRVRASLAEALMNSGKLEGAIQVFEGVKKRIQAEIVFDKPVLFINTCNQLGNCYLNVRDLENAKENFEKSLLLIKKLDQTSERVEDVIVSKIYLNLGIIASSQEKPSESVHYLERALDFLQRDNPTEMTAEFQNIYVLLAMSLTRKGSTGAACESYHKALNISKTVYGEESEEASYSLIQHAESLSAIGRDTAASNQLEFAALILSKLEQSHYDQRSGKRQTQAQKDAISLKLNKVYLQLINLYFAMEHKAEDGQRLVEQVEIRLEQNLEDPMTFKLINELANILRKHDNLSVSIQLYKKALLSIKTRFKNNYLEQRDTSKILINIASTEYMRDNTLEALKYYHHALTVLINCYDEAELEKKENYLNGSPVATLEADSLTPAQRALTTDCAKVHISIGQIQKQLNDFREASYNYNKAVQCLERGAEVTKDTSEMMLECRSSLEELQTNI